MCKQTNILFSLDESICMKNYIECPKCKTENELKLDVPPNKQMCHKCWNFLHNESYGIQPELKAKTPKYAPGYKGFGGNSYEKTTTNSFPFIWVFIALCLALWLLWTLMG